MEVNTSLLPSRLKVKLGTSEMRLKNKLNFCVNLVPKNCSSFSKDFASLNSDYDTPLSQTLRKRRLEKTKKNPFFIWNDVKELKVSFHEFEKLASMIAYETDSKPQEALEKLWQYQALVEELVTILEESVYQLCRSHGVSLPQSFPRDFKPRVNEDEAVVQVSLELQQQEASESGQEKLRPEVLLRADKPQQKAQPEILLEADKPQHEAQQPEVLREADRPQQERLEVSLEAKRPQHKVQQVLLVADQPKHEMQEVLPETERAQEEVLLEAERPQQEIQEVLEAERPQIKLKEGELEADRPQHKVQQVLHEVGKPQQGKRGLLEAKLLPSPAVPSVLLPSSHRMSSPSIAGSARLVRFTWDPGGS